MISFVNFTFLSPDGEFLSMPFAEGSMPMWLLIAVVIILAIMVVWQVVAERRRIKNAHRETKNAQNEASRILSTAQTKADQITQRAEQQSATIVKEAQSRAKEVVAAAKEDFEQSVAERRTEVRKAEERIAQREEHFESRLVKLQERLNDLDKREENLKRQSESLIQKNVELDLALGNQLSELQRIACLSQEDARKELLERLENSMTQERGQLIRRFQEETRQQLADEGRKVMIDAMQRYAGDCTYERTTAVIPLPNEEMKGRIIGREGRNIRSLENATGASILVDDTPQAVVISCFDPVRREIARQVMEKMVTDGRIHPGRVEELVAKIKKDVENDIQKTGQETVEKLGVMRLRPNLIALLGRLKFRYSFSQNVLAHSIEVASMMGAIAASVGLDETKARRAGLLHDIGKAVDHEVEGSHASIGADLLRRAGEDEEIINAVAAHHEECEKTSLMAVLVQICDAVSAGRPGARSETTELYLKRLEDLERIGRSFDGVEDCYAIQAGRELRVVVRPEKVTEEQAAIIARNMAERIEKEMRYPGQIRISIIRETRAVEYAK